MEERNAIPQRPAAPIHVGQASRDCEAVDEGVREYAAAVERYITTLEEKLKRSKQRHFTSVTVLAFFYLALMFMLIYDTALVKCKL